ncbi:hypothetical protein [Mesorhizobium sp. BR1-1-14]|uniref:hypothetical protein n=1 Tax=Mesorhizobium sp. BR1-1-14 TaxID=2876655 RepID=UPI001CD15B2E|nr:hypothetical protein [Mesorhizobium sp. BR1-1-14]MBZ9960625.1 hypothetical protein [Mesorhizobium sp. BR1-1-14]
MNDTPVYPKIGMKLIGLNAPLILVVAALGAALERGGVEREEIDRILGEAVCDGFANIMPTCMKYVRVY